MKNRGWKKMTKFKKCTICPSKFNWNIRNMITRWEVLIRTNYKYCKLRIERF